MSCAVENKLNLYPFKQIRRNDNLLHKYGSMLASTVKSSSVPFSLVVSVRALTAPLTEILSVIYVRLQPYRLSPTFKYFTSLYGTAGGGRTGGIVLLQYTRRKADSKVFLQSVKSVEARGQAPPRSIADDAGKKYLPTKKKQRYLPLESPPALAKALSRTHSHQLSKKKKHLRKRGECITLISAFINLNNNEPIFSRSVDQ